MLGGIYEYYLPDFDYNKDQLISVIVMVMTLTKWYSLPAMDPKDVKPSIYSPLEPLKSRFRLFSIEKKKEK